MSLRLRISVLRWRQLSAIAGFYEPLDGGDQRVPAEAPPSVLELPPRAVELAKLRPVAGGRKVVKSPRLGVVEACDRICRSDEFHPLQMPFGAPDRTAAACFRRRPLVVRVCGHGDDRA